MPTIIVLLLSLCCLTAAQAQDLPQRYAQASAAGLELLDGSVTSIALLDNDARIDVQGLTASVQITQLFSYNGQSGSDARYVFPLPDNAAVHRMQIRIGDRTINGVIKEKSAARAVYAKARAQGRRAALLEQQRGNLFSVDIAQIQPGDVLRVELEYIQSVSFADGEFSLRYPRYYVQRYHSVADSADVEDVPTQTVYQAEHYVGGSVDIGMPIATLQARYHALQLQRQGHRYEFTMGDAKKYAADDFVLRWQIDTGNDVRLAAFAETLDSQQYLHLLLLPPVYDVVQANAREQTYIIDVSGSMAGPAVRQAKQSLLQALAQLQAGDTFNIVAYNDRAWSLFETPQAAVDFNLVLARSFVDGLDADGGTEMLPALEMALSQPLPATDTLAQVLFMTDGAVANEAQLLATIDAKLGSRRLFTLGIGSAPNTYFMRKAAQLGRGSFVFVANSEELPDEVDRLLRRIQQPALSDISIEWPQGITPEFYPKKVPDLYQGESLLVSARIAESAALPGQIMLRARHAGRVWHAAADIPKHGAAAAPGTLAAVWARAKIESLTDAINALGGVSDAMQQRDTLRNAVIDTALSHHLVSQFTSFVAVDSEQLPVSQHSDSRSYHLAQTANGATQSMIWGFLLLLMFAILHRSLRRAQ